MALNIYIFPPIRLGTYNSIWGRLSLVVLTKTTSSPRPQHSTTKQKESYEAVKLLLLLHSRGEKIESCFQYVLCPLSTLSRIYTSLKLQQLPVKCHGEHPRLHERALDSPNSSSRFDKKKIIFWRNLFSEATQLSSALF